MSPVMALRNGRVVYALGLPGGRKIFPSALQALLNLVDHGMTLQEAVEAPRVWTEGPVLEVEHGIAEPAGLTHWTAAAVDALRKLELKAELRFCLDVMLDERQHALEQVARATRRLEELAKADRHHAAVATLRTVPGVGPITAMTFRVELHEPGRFDNGGQVARMIGLAPQVLQSGPTRREGRLLKSGNARLRKAITSAATGSARYQEPVVQITVSAT